MRSSRVALVVGLLVFCLGAGAQAQTTQQLQVQIKQLQSQLQQAMHRLQVLEAKVKVAQPAPPPAAAPGRAWYDKLKVDGYFQSRYLAPEGGSDTFTIRRLFLNFHVDLNQRTKALVTVSRLTKSDDPHLDLYYAQIDYKLDPNWTLRFGQVGNTFGYDQVESSSRRLPLERAAVVCSVPASGSRPGLKGLYFGGRLDRGMYLIRKPNGDEPQFTVGLLNGNFAAPDNNQNKMYSLDLRWLRPHLSYGASWISGDYTATNGDGSLGATTRRQALDLFFHTDPTPWGFQGEYVDGKLLGHDIRGWYGQVARNLGRGTPFVRYESYDPQRDVPDDAYTALHLGYAYQMDKANKLTLQVTNAGRRPAPGEDKIDYDEVGLQWQLKY